MVWDLWFASTHLRQSQSEQKVDLTRAEMVLWMISYVNFYFLFDIHKLLVPFVAHSIALVAYLTASDPPSVLR